MDVLGKFFVHFETQNSQSKVKEGKEGEGRGEGRPFYRKNEGVKE